MGTIVGGFNHSDAICSTPFFALTVDIFPGETRGVCVRVCMTMRDSEGQTSISTEHNIFIFYTTIQLNCITRCLIPNFYFDATNDHFQDSVSGCQSVISYCSLFEELPINGKVVLLYFSTKTTSLVLAHQC